MLVLNKIYPVGSNPGSLVIGVDEQSQPLRGVSVAIKGTNQGKISRFVGKYSLNASLTQYLQPDVAGGQNNRNDGMFDWSGRAQQFGISGRFLFARLSLALK